MVAHARFNSVRIGTRARDLEDLDVDQEFMGFSLPRGLKFFFLRVIWSGDGNYTACDVARVHASTVRDFGR